MMRRRRDFNKLKAIRFFSEIRRRGVTGILGRWICCVVLKTTKESARSNSGEKNVREIEC